MATKTKATRTTKSKAAKTLKKSRTVVMDSVQSIHNQVLDTTEDLIEVSVITGEKYQKIAAKAIKKSEPLITKQVDIVFDTLEEMYDQYEYGTKRILNLLGIKDQVKIAKNVGKSVVKAAQKRFGKNVVSFGKTAQGAAEATIKVVTKKKAKAEKKAKATAKKLKNSDVVASTTKAVKAKVAKASKKSKSAAKKAVKTTVKATKVVATKAPSTRGRKSAPATTKRATKVSKATKVVNPVLTVADDLKKITGVGPKMEGLFNQIGVYTYKDLAAYNKKSLTASVEAIYPSARMASASKWIQHAKRLAK